MPSGIKLRKRCNCIAQIRYLFMLMIIIYYVKIYILLTEILLEANKFVRKLS